MRRRHLYRAKDNIYIKRFIPSGGGVHVYRDDEYGSLIYIGAVERFRMPNRQRKDEHITVWLPVNKDASPGAPQASLRDGVERIVRVNDIRNKGYTAFTLQKGK